MLAHMCASCIVGKAHTNYVPNDHPFNDVIVSDYNGAVKVGQHASPYCHDPASPIKRLNEKDVCKKEGHRSQHALSENTRACSLDQIEEDHVHDNANSTSERQTETVVDFFGPSSAFEPPN